MSASLFATLWSTAVLFSLLSNSDGFSELRVSPASAKSLIEIALAVSALATLWRPGARRPLLAMAVLQLADALWALPFTFNHRLVLASVNAALVVCAIRNRSSETHPIECAAPAARSIVLLVYAFAFFAKLNTDFLNPVSSCAVEFSRHIGPFVDRIPGAADAVVYGTLAVEAALPLLLLVPATRAIGVVLGLAFHFALSFDLIRHFVDFSSVMSAGLLLFAGLDVAADASQRASRRLALAFGVLIAAGFAVHTLALGGRPAQLGFMLAVQLVWVGYAVVLLVLAIRFRGSAPDTRGAFALRPALVPIVALVALNGLTPYLGLKTHTAWNMYSNLDVGADGSNHLLVPRSLDLLGLQRETVTLLSARPDAAQLEQQLGDRIPDYFTRVQLAQHVRLLEPGARWPRIELERVWEVFPELKITIEGETQHEISAGDSAATDSPWRRLARKLLLLRPAAANRPPECRW